MYNKPVELQQLSNGTIQYILSQYIHDVLRELSVHPFHFQIIQMHHQWHVHPVSVQIIHHQYHLIPYKNSHRMQKNPTETKIMHKFYIHISKIILFQKKNKLTTCLAVQSYGKPRMRTITAAPRDRNACASQFEPPATDKKSSPLARYTSIYLKPIWCLWRFKAMSRCSWFIKRINASPLRRPAADRHNATPPLRKQKWNRYSLLFNENEKF